MHRTKRTWLIIVSVLLILLLAFSALAEGALSTLYDAGAALLLETDNVTLTGHAVFTYDGQQFKTLDGQYIQDGVNSVMDVSLITPLPLGGTRTGGYKVIANGDTVYGDVVGEGESFGPQTKAASSSVLSNKNMTKLIASLGGTVVRLAEGGLNDHITVSADGENTAYRLVLSEKQTPNLFNKALSMVARGMIDEYFPFHTSLRSLPIVTVDDREMLLANIYEEMHGEPLTKLAVTASQEERPTDYMRYEAACEAMFAYIDKVEQTTPYSAVVIHADDKSQTTYDSYNAYLQAIGQKVLQFEDYSLCLNAYAQQHPDSADPAADMRAYYQQILSQSDCAGMLVEGDGDYILCRNDEELIRLSPTKPSVTQRICTQMKEISLHAADITAVLDADERVTSFSGQLSLKIVDYFGREHVLTIDFDCAAKDYDTSKIEVSDYYYQQEGNG